MNTPRKFGRHDAKAATAEAERGISFEFATGVFDDPAHIDFDVSRPEDGEERRKAAGLVEGRLYALVYTTRGDVTWIISARRANKAEARAYGSVRS